MERIRSNSAKASEISNCLPLSTVVFIIFYSRIIHIVTTGACNTFRTVDESFTVQISCRRWRALETIRASDEYENKIYGFLSMKIAFGQNKKKTSRAKIHSRMLQNHWLR
jgi:hypothetical protein